MLRALSLIALLSVMVTSSLHVAVARGGAPAVESMVICAAHGVQIIHVDAQGNETGAPRLCPDCIPNLVGVPNAANQPRVVRVGASLQHWHRPDSTRHLAETLSRRARAPPVAV